MDFRFKLKHEGEIKMALHDCKQRLQGDWFGYEHIGNEILYEMCRKYPKHENKAEVYSKLWLIGRSYAASLERNKKKASSSDIYEKVLKELVDTRGEEIDRSLGELQPITDEASMKAVLSLHQKFVEIFNSATDLRKRSLASKYLHFHRRDVFYIYDNYANRALNRYVSRIGGNLEGNYDKEYLPFVQKAHGLQGWIKEKFMMELSPRDLDDLLLYLYHEHVK